MEWRNGASHLDTTAMGSTIRPRSGASWKPLVQSIKST
ncbi:hypothetical protein SAMN04488600_107111 [Paenibacillus polymyxa]|nr:hypothetical protein SAMN04488600_107111 [Paenibacillus polymyxa]